jgi:hypothetical protein
MPGELDPGVYKTILEALAASIDRGGDGMVIA